MKLLFSFVNDFGEIPCDYENILFLLKLLTTNFSIHQWLSPKAIVTVEFWWRFFFILSFPLYLLSGLCFLIVEACLLLAGTGAYLGSM